MAASIICITRDRPRCLLSLGSLFQISKGLTQASFKLLPLHWAYETCVSLYEWILSWSLCISISKPSCWPSRADVLLGFFLPSSGPLDEGVKSDPLPFLGRTFSIVIVFPICELPTQGCGSWMCSLLLLLTHLVVVPSYFFICWKLFLLVFNCCSVNSCNFGGKWALLVFLFLHLGHMLSLPPHQWGIF